MHSVSPRKSFTVKDNLCRHELHLITIQSSVLSRFTVTSFLFVNMHTLNGRWNVTIKWEEWCEVHKRKKAAKQIKLIFKIFTIFIFPILTINGLFFKPQSVTTVDSYMASPKISQLSILVGKVKRVSTPLLISQFTSTQDLINYGNRIFLLILRLFCWM